MHLHFTRPNPVFHMKFDSRTTQTAKTIIHTSFGKLFHLENVPDLKKLTDKFLNYSRKSPQNVNLVPHILFLLFNIAPTFAREETIFNREIEMDLMDLNKTTAIHVLDTATNFQNSIFIKSKSTEDLLQHFLIWWETVYTVCTDNIREATANLPLVLQIFHKMPNMSMLTLGLAVLSSITPLDRVNDIIIHYNALSISPLKINPGFLAHKTYTFTLEQSTTPWDPTYMFHHYWNLECRLASVALQLSHLANQNYWTP